MLEAWESVRLFYIQYSIPLSLIAVFSCLVLRDIKAARYAILIALFYIIGSFTGDFIRAIDDELVYRYIFWAFNDIVFMAIIAVWAIKDKVYMWQSVIAQLIIIPAPILQMFRLVDRHLMELSYSSYLYVTIIPIVNFATLCLAFVPVIAYFQLKHKRMQDGALESIEVGR
ncbi:hypothetical protein CBQ28_10870 [Pseudoalteromonas sp. GCY]|uniref:hypothetical protein n=1 Tax=Pseudoalteromonas sp. GCY TaxID=2003316 RepID=UPI000BFEDB4C|nr:hypothetical protein [Pseudoalteromonas sp. GCY]PHI37160.1 hypothetical protein CBQ28_10870 [Pseudoalteromonas sp. GCY]QQQ66400.1 hypothetical protein JJQ94_19300 [Pseudoalteromonas sp. GCY]